MGRGRGFGRGKNDFFFRYGRQHAEGQKEPSPQQKIQHQEQGQDTAVPKVPPEQSRRDHDAHLAQQQSRSLPGSDLSYDNTLSPEAAQRMNALPDNVKAQAIEAAKPAAKSVFDQYAPKSTERGRDQEQAHEAEKTQEMERGGGEEH
jgi:hypothetical protein